MCRYRDEENDVRIEVISVYMVVEIMGILYYIVIYCYVMVLLYCYGNDNLNGL